MYNLFQPETPTPAAVTRCAHATMPEPSRIALETRLPPSLGAKEAAELCCCFLRNTATRISGVVRYEPGHNLDNAVSPRRILRDPPSWWTTGPEADRPTASAPGTTELLAKLAAINLWVGTLLADAPERATLL